MESIILLSGGLDSLVSLGLTKNQYNVSLALTFDYGQKSVKKEIEASRKICEFYNLAHKVLSLPWLQEITHTALVSDYKIPVKNELKNPNHSADTVWVPNRNGLFLNIAAAFADAENYDYIIIGANKEEGETFSDNTKEFIESVNNEFIFSTHKKTRVAAPLINCQKYDIVKLAVENQIPLQLVWSCYGGNEKHCGECESCTRLKRALNANNDTHYMKEIFGI